MGDKIESKKIRDGMRRVSDGARLHGRDRDADEAVKIAARSAIR
jgi:hypothetical protein